MPSCQLDKYGWVALVTEWRKVKHFWSREQLENKHSIRRLSRSEKTRGSHAESAEDDAQRRPEKSYDVRPAARKRKNEQNRSKADRNCAIERKRMTFCKVTIRAR